MPSKVKKLEPVILIKNYTDLELRKFLTPAQVEAEFGISKSTL
jgi:hypothetical protein